MTDNMVLSVTCGECKAPLAEDQFVPRQPSPCPQCGSFKRHINIEISEHVNLEIKEFIGLRAKNVSLPSKDKLRLHIQQGDDFHRKTDTWMKKERIIDKDSDSYKEVITNPETGEVVRHCEESLSSHVGRRSAKQKE